MVPKKIIDALKIIVDDFKKHKIKWVIAGSLSLALQGVDIVPKDIDIITTKEDALRLNKIWKEYTIKSVSFGQTEFFRSYFGIFQINDVKIEVMGNLEEKRKDKWVSLMNRLNFPKYVIIENMQLPVSPLEDQLKSYEMSGRKKDIERAIKIRKVLE
ncbi:MAG: nucleotidyltransferase domain-containing protein [Candidatus Asgardarchaeia archaeon]